jgi:flagellar capping protein FliD
VDGTLSVASASTADSTGLNDALTNNFTAVRSLFQSGSASGVAQKLNAQLTTLTSTVNGPLSLDMAGINRQVADLNTQIASFQLQLQKTQTHLLAEYAQINATLEQMPQLLAQINSQLDALNPSK